MTVGYQRWLPEVEGWYCNCCGHGLPLNWIPPWPSICPGCGTPDGGLVDISAIQEMVNQDYGDRSFKMIHGCAP